MVQFLTKNILSLSCTVIAMFMCISSNRKTRGGQTTARGPNVARYRAQYGPRKPAAN